MALHIARGLHHMHSRKVMHLDLKSANILLARDGTAKVADVGLAKILTRDNTHVSMEGTFDWAAPEVRARSSPLCTRRTPPTPGFPRRNWATSREVVASSEGVDMC